MPTAWLTITAFFFERGGGSYFEVFGNEAGGGKAFLLTKDGAGFRPGPGSGLPLIGATPLPFQILSLTRTGSSVSITFESKENGTYVIEKTTTLDPAEFQELTDGYESEGETTTFTDEAATELEAYYRVREEN